MTKKVEMSEAAFGNPVFAFGLDENGKPRGARFAQGLNDRVVSAVLDMNCRVIQNHSAALAALGMKLPVGRVANKDFVTLAEIKRMRQLCRVPPSEQGTEASPIKTPVPSKTEADVSAQDALRARLKQTRIHKQNKF